MKGTGPSSQQYRLAADASTCGTEQTELLLTISRSPLCWMVISLKTNYNMDSCHALSKILYFHSPRYIPKYPSALYVFRKQSNLYKQKFSVTNIFVSSWHSWQLVAGFPPWLGFIPRPGHVVDKVALGQAFSEYFDFPCKFSFHQLLHTHHQPSSGGWYNRPNSGRCTRWTQYHPNSPPEKHICFKHIVQI
jgi:hypothetical protein